MGERDPTSTPSGKNCLNILDLEPQRPATWLDRSRCLLQEDREPLAVLQCNEVPLGDLKFDREAELGDILIARPGHIADRYC